MKDDCKIIRKVLDDRSMELAIEEMALKLVRMHPDHNNLIVLGMATRGIPLANRLCERLKELYKADIKVGAIDATFYRDDFHYRSHVGNPELRILSTPVVEGKTVILVDDVLYTGRSVRAAMEAVFALGRPSEVRLCCLIDRGCRELPIAPDCVGESVTTALGEEVRVRIKPIDEEDAVYLVGV